MIPRRQYCTLKVGELFLGIDVEQIREVLHNTSFTPVPLANPTIRGLINLRGQIITAIDLRRRLRITAPETDAPTATMVIDTTEEPLALVVDSVGDVVEVDHASFEPPPKTLKGEARKMIEGAHKLERDLLLIINLRTVIDFDGETDDG